MKKPTGKKLNELLEERVRRYSVVPHYVLITGERGTGKTTIAKRLHRLSQREAKEFVNLNCATLTEELLESELFGYEKGAFTGAVCPKAGLFEIAGGGTLFLDEVGEIALNLQAKLLKAVEEKRIRRVGGSAERPIDVRIIAATSQNLKEQVSRGKFRPDLFDRLNILSLETVPLRFQKEKIPEIFLAKLDAERSAVGREHPFKVSDEAIALLEEYDWPGNYRELLNFATRLAVEFSGEEIIEKERIRRILPDLCREADFEKISGKIQEFEAFAETSNEDLVTVRFDPKATNLKEIYLKAAANCIQHLLLENDGNLRRTARVMGTTHTTLSRIMKKYKRQEKRGKILPLSAKAERFAATASAA